MAWIRTIEALEAKEPLGSIYHEQQQQAGSIANILKVHSIAPEILRSHLEIYRAAMHRPGKLGHPQREMIATVVSAANGCVY